MRLILAALVASAGTLVGLRAQTPPEVRAVAVSPEPATRLAAGQNLCVRLAYRSDQPLRFQASGFLHRQKHDLAMNGSPAYPAGTGEAIVWVFGQPGARIDELRVTAYDAKWRSLLVVSVPVPAEWHAGVAPAPVDPWVKELDAARVRLAAEETRHPAAAGSLLLGLWTALSAVIVPLAFLSVPAYPVIQIYAWWRLRGPARLLSSLPVSFMAPVYAYCAWALGQQSNLWPLPAIFASPVALVITLTVLLAARARARAGVAAAGPAPTGPG